MLWDVHIHNVQQKIHANRICVAAVCVSNFNCLFWKALSLQNFTKSSCSTAATGDGCNSWVSAAESNDESSIFAMS